MGFWLIFSFVVIQRLVELKIAKNHEISLKSKGAYEVGASHYKWMVSLHVLFFISLVMEVQLLGRQAPIWFWFPLCFFLAAQGVRIWAIRSLGEFWNTKIIILKNAGLVTQGPYRWIRHPNYLIVSVEILTLPLVFNAYLTAILFSILNAVILSIRVPLEEQALLESVDE